jgi:hypothetical protein
MDHEPCEGAVQGGSGDDGLVVEASANGTLAIYPGKNKQQAGVDNVYIPPMAKGEPWVGHPAPGGSRRNIQRLVMSYEL